MRASLSAKFPADGAKNRGRKFGEDPAPLFFCCFFELRAGDRGAQFFHYITALHICQLANYTNLSRSGS